MYGLTAGSWTLLATLMSSWGAAAQTFGRAVAMVDEWAVVGEYDKSKYLSLANVITNPNVMPITRQRVLLQGDKHSWIVDVDNASSSTCNWCWNQSRYHSEYASWSHCGVDDWESNVVCVSLLLAR